MFSFFRRERISNNEYASFPLCEGVKRVAGFNCLSVPPGRNYVKHLNQFGTKTQNCEDVKRIESPTQRSSNND